MKYQIAAFGVATLLALGVACGKGGPPPQPTPALPERVTLFGGGAETVKCRQALSRINRRVEEGHRLVEIQGFGLDNSHCILVWEK